MSIDDCSGSSSSILSPFDTQDNPDEGCPNSNHFSCSELNALTLVNIIISILSLVGEIYMLYHFIKKKENRSNEMIFVLGLVISDTLYSIANLMAIQNPASDQWTCTFQGFLREFSFNSTCLWAMEIVYITFRYNRYKEKLIEIFYKSIYYNGILSALPPSIVLIFHYLDPSIMSYGSDMTFCDIVPNSMNLIFSELPQFVMVVIAFALGYKIVQNNKSNGSSSRILIYPGILLGVVIPICVDRIVYLITGQPLFLLLLIQILCLRFTGFLNAIVYGFHKKFKVSDNSEDYGSEIMNAQKITIKEDYDEKAEKKYELEKRLTIENIH